MVSYERFFFLFSIFNHRSARKGRDIREELAEVRPDPDIGDRDVAETARAGELLVF